MKQQAKRNGSLSQNKILVLFESTDVISHQKVHIKTESASSFALRILFSAYSYVLAQGA